MWKEARFIWCGTERLEPVPDNKSGYVDFKDYDSCYPPFFFIFWEDEVDDYKYMFMGKPQSDADTLEQLRLQMAQLSEELLPSGDFTTPDDVIWKPSSSNAYVGEGKTKPEWEVEYDDPDSDNIGNHLNYLRGQAMKRPSEVRDIGTHTVESLRLHRKMMYPMQVACRKIRGCPYGKDQSYVRKVVEFIGNKCHYYYMRDYTKSGMTMPSDVRDAIIMGFFDRDKALGRQYCKAFNNQVLLLSRDSCYGQRPNTGTPLGMFVEGFTLMSYAIHNIIVRSMGGNHKLYHSGTNDDVIVGSPNKESIQAYTNADVDIQRDLGMWVKPTKSGITEEKFIYCEEYWDGDFIISKTVLPALAIIGAKYAINVVHAKELVNSILLSLPYFSSQVKAAIREVQTSYDYEFSDQEYQWPYLFGGWYPTYRDGLDCSIEYHNGDSIQEAAYWAARQEPKKCKTLQESPSLSYGRKLNLTLVKRPEVESFMVPLLPIFGTKKALKDHYTLTSRRPGALVVHYNRKYAMRANFFRNILSGKQGVEPLRHEWLVRHPNSVIVKGLPGVRYAPIEFWHTPSIGLETAKRQDILSIMRHLGYIDFPSASKIPKSVVKLYHMGFIENVSYERIGIAKEGVSYAMLKTTLKGLRKFNLEHNLTIKSVTEDDMIVPLTEYWNKINAPMSWLIRIDRYSRVGEQYYLSHDTSEFWQEFIEKGFKVVPEEDDPYETPPPETNVVIDSLFEEQVKTNLRRLLDGSSMEFKARFAPREASRGLLGSHIPSEAVEPPPEGYYYSGEGNLLPLDCEPTTSFWDAPSEDEDEEVCADWNF
jgi:hypothetical protein